jgi:hypothetical protein
MYEYRDDEVVPYAGRTVSALIGALAPAKVRELTRRVRQHNKMYGGGSGGGGGGSPSHASGGSPGAAPSSPTAAS